MEKYNIKFKKQLGQNFLKNKAVVQKIVDIANVNSDSLVIEVGPGGAIMTRELAKKEAIVLAYEVDGDLKVELYTRLNGFNNVTI